MGQFLRDEQLSNLTIDGETLERLAAVLATRQFSMPEHLENPTADPPPTFLNYTIRFDQKGYRVFDKEQLSSYFATASRVERVVCELISGMALNTNRLGGSYVDLRLDADDKAPSALVVSSDDEDWVNATFSAVKDILSKANNRNGLMRNPWTEFLIQILGVLTGFFVSLWGASLIAPQLKIENPFLISFVLVLLVFSNMWVPIRQKLLSFLTRLFPPIRFYRKDRDSLHWLGQAVVGGIVVALALYLLSWAFTYAGNLLNHFMNAP